MDPNSPEITEVERIYRARDQRIERGELVGIVLTEEEHKKHQKEGTLPTQWFESGIITTYEIPYAQATTPVKTDFIKNEM